MSRFKGCCNSKSKNKRNLGNDKQLETHASNSTSTSLKQGNVVFSDDDEMNAQTSQESCQQENLNNRFQDGRNAKSSSMNQKQQTSSYADNDSNRGMLSTNDSDSIEDSHANSEKNLSGHMKTFLQHRQEFSWLTQQFDHSVGSDHFTKMVVHSTFRADLSKSDFGFYIDTTFNDFPREIQKQMKDLYNQTVRKPVSGEIIIDEHSDGVISATLIQILSRKNDQDELEMLVGSVGVTQRPNDRRRFNRSYLEQHKEQVKKALQYMYAKEALKELPEE